MELGIWWLLDDQAPATGTSVAPGRIEAGGRQTGRKGLAFAIDSTEPLISSTLAALPPPPAASRNVIDGRALFPIVCAEPPTIRQVARTTSVRYTSLRVRRPQGPGQSALRPACARPPKSSRCDQAVPAEAFRSSNLTTSIQRNQCADNAS